MSEDIFEEGEGIYYVPRAIKSPGRFDRGGDVCLLMDYAFRTRLDAGYWGATNWYALHAFGLGYEGVERLSLGTEMTYLEGDLLGVGRLWIIGGPRLEEALSKHLAVSEHDAI